MWKGKDDQEIVSIIVFQSLSLQLGWCYLNDDWLIKSMPSSILQTVFEIGLGSSRPLRLYTFRCFVLYTGRRLTLLIINSYLSNNKKKKNLPFKSLFSKIGNKKRLDLASFPIERRVTRSVWILVHLLLLSLNLISLAWSVPHQGNPITSIRGLSSSC